MAENENPEGGDAGKGGYTPPATQADLDAIIKDRVARERAKFADYTTLRDKAAKLDQIEQANQTEAEKTARQIAELQAQLADTQTSALRARIQARHGISDEDAALFLTATDEATLTKQAERLAERAEDRKKNGGRAPLQGRTATSTGDDPMREFARGLVGRND